MVILFFLFIGAFHSHQVHSYIRQVPLYNRQVDVYAKHLRISSLTQTIIGKHCFGRKKALLCNGQNSALTKVIFFTSKRKTAKEKLVSPKMDSRIHFSSYLALNVKIKVKGNVSRGGTVLKGEVLSGSLSSWFHYKWQVLRRLQ